MSDRGGPSRRERKGGKVRSQCEGKEDIQKRVDQGHRSPQAPFKEGCRAEKQR